MYVKYPEKLMILLIFLYVNFPWYCYGYALGNLDCQNWYPDPIEIDFGLSKNPFPKIQIPSHLANFPPELAQTNRLAKT